MEIAFRGFKLNEKFLTFRKITISEGRRGSSNEEVFLKEASKEDIFSLRRSKEAYLFLKKDGKLYYAKIDKRINLFGSNLLKNIGEHQCFRNCRSMIPETLDWHQACPKVVYYNGGIEMYDFILNGYETINTIRDCFIVSTCSMRKN